MNNYIIQFFNSFSTSWETVFLLFFGRIILWNKIDFSFRNKFDIVFIAVRIVSLMHWRQKKSPQISVNFSFIS